MAVTARSIGAGDGHGRAGSAPELCTGQQGPTSQPFLSVRNRTIPPDWVGHPAVDATATGNRILDAIPAAERRAVLVGAERVHLSVKDVVFEQARPIGAVHFPINSVVSLVTLLQDGSVIEMSTVGNEGTTSAPLLLGMSGIANASGLCQIAGDAIAMPAASFERAVEGNPGLRAMCLRHVGVLLVGIGQSVACARLHTSTQRCARWLLTTRDRVGADSFRLTHELLSFMLGARRASVSEALSRLAADGAVTSRRGTITILDRRRLGAHACECYAVTRQAIDAMLRPRPIRH